MAVGSEEQSQINTFPPCIIPSKEYLIPGEGQKQVKVSGHGDKEEPRICGLQSGLLVMQTCMGKQLGEFQCSG